MNSQSIIHTHIKTQVKTHTGSQSGREAWGSTGEAMSATPQKRRDSLTEKKR
jgi:hypothetical protein